MDIAFVEMLARRGRIGLAEAAAPLGATHADLPDALMARLRDAGVPASLEGDALVWSGGAGLDVAAVVRELTEARHTCPVEYRVATDSTNSRLLQAAAANALVPQALFAGLQTDGRGRRGRRWQGRYGDTLMFSLLVDSGRPVRELPGLALAAGVALAEALERLGIDGIGLKWPNDLLLDGGKLAGVLVEAATSSRPGLAVIGVGLNWHLPALQAGSAETLPPVSALAPALADANSDLDQSVVAGRLLAALLKAGAAFRKNGLAAFLDGFARFDVLFGQALDVIDATGSHRGIGEGIAADGALRVRHDGTETRYHSAEVSVRRR